MTVKTIEKEYKKKIERNRRSREVHIEAYYLGMISAIVMNEIVLKETEIESIKELVINNMVKNGHEDKVPEAMSYITPEKLKAAVPILAYRCFDYYDAREKEMKEAFDKRMLDATKVEEKPKNKVISKPKKKYVVKIHKK